MHVSCSRLGVCDIPLRLCACDGKVQKKNAQRHWARVNGKKRLFLLMIVRINLKNVILECPYSSPKKKQKRHRTKSQADCKRRRRCGVMDIKDKSTIQRMLGKIEGVAFIVDDKIATPLLDAIEVIDAVLDREEGAQ